MYPINVKTPKPIGPKFLWDLTWPQEMFVNAQNFKKLSQKNIMESAIFCCNCPKRKCSQIKLATICCWNRRWTRSVQKAFYIKKLVPWYLFFSSDKSQLVFEPVGFTFFPIFYFLKPISVIQHWFILELQIIFIKILFYLLGWNVEDKQTKKNTKISPELKKILLFTYPGNENTKGSKEQCPLHFKSAI